MNISRDALSKSNKPFIAWATVQGRPETLVYSFHTSGRAAEAGMLKLKKSLDGGLLAWGWSDIRESDRKYGMVV